jgi:NDP-sugar pyrophosphorylase family protein
MNQLVILAGGKGSRIASLQEQMQNYPKTMFPLGGKPILEHQIELGKKYGFKKVLLLVGYRAEMIEQYFKDGSTFGMEISYQKEDVPLGTAGALLSAFDKLEETFILMYGDTALNVNLERFLQFHQGKKADISLFVHPNDHPYDSDLVDVGIDSRVLGLHSYPHPQGVYLPNLVNAALYVINRSVLAPYIAHIEKNDLAKHLFPKMLKQGSVFFGYKSIEYIKDMGTEDRFEKVNRDFQNGKIQKTDPAPAVFLDRDGTLIKYVPFLNTPEQLELFPQVGAALKKLNNSEYRTALITNQTQSRS